MSTIYRLRILISRKASVLPKMVQALKTDSGREIARFFGVRSIDWDRELDRQQTLMEVVLVQDRFVPHGLHAAYFAFVISNILAQYVPHETFDVACAIIAFESGNEFHQIQRMLRLSSDLCPTDERIQVVDLFPRP